VAQHAGLSLSFLRQRTALISSLALGYHLSSTEQQDRNWAQVSEDPTPVLDALYKYDQGGARYLTNVAQRLLEKAALNDEKIDSIYRVEMIP